MAYVIHGLSNGVSPVILSGGSALSTFHVPRSTFHRPPSTLHGRSPLRKHRSAARGKHRIFNAAEYRFYRSNSAPPVEGSVPYATAASLPDTPANTFGNGTWYISVSYFNGVLDSGFLPIGPRGETYLRLDIAAGVVTNSPPAAPLRIELQQAAGGQTRVLALYAEDAALRAGEWAIAYTDDGSDPPADTPDVTLSIARGGNALLDYLLPAADDGDTVKVRVQTRRAVTERLWLSGTLGLAVMNGEYTKQSATLWTLGENRVLHTTGWSGDEWWAIPAGGGGLDYLVSVGSLLGPWIWIFGHTMTGTLASTYFGPWAYSEGSTVLSILADAAGPSAPIGGDAAPEYVAGST